jgi:hypothetical protein
MNRFMSQALVAPDPLTPEFLRRVHAQSMSTKDQALLLALVRRTDLPEDLLEVFKADKRIDVRAACLTRPGLTPEQVATEVGQETRTGVLTAVLKDSESSPELLAVVEAAFRAKPTKGLAEAFASHARHQLSLSTAAAVLVTLEPSLDRASSAVSSGARRLFERVASSPPDADAFARVSQRPEFVAALLAQGDLGLEATTAVLGTAMEHRSPSTRHHRVVSDEVFLDCAKSLLARFPADAPSALSTLLGAHPTWDADRSASLRYDFEEVLLSAGASLPEPAPAGSDERTPGALRTSLVSSDSEELTAAFEVFKQLEEGTKRDAFLSVIGVTRLARNLALSGPDAVTVFNSLGRRTGTTLPALTWMAKARKDPRMARSLVLLKPQEIDPELLALCERPRALLRKMAKSQFEAYEKTRQAGRPWDTASEAARLARVVSQDCFPPTLMAEFLPWSAFDTSLGMGTGIHALVASRLSEELGEDPATWETFAGLADSFEGTVAELLELAKTLS